MILDVDGGGIEVAEEQVQRADARRNRARLLAVAAEVFATDGTHVRVDAVARRAGVGVGTVYRHFPTKQALLEAILADRLQGMRDLAGELAHGVRTGDDPGPAFFALLDAMFDRGAEDRAVKEALEGSGADLAALVAGGAEGIRAATGNLLAAAQRAGAVRSDVDADGVLALVAGTFHALDRYPGGGGTAPARRILYDGLRPPSP